MNKYIVGTLCVASFILGSGLFNNSAKEEVQYVEKTKEVIVEKQVEKKVYVAGKRVTTTTKDNNKNTETILVVEEDIKEQSETEIESKKQLEHSVEQTVISKQNNYSLGVSYHVSSFKDVIVYDFRNIQIEVGKRVLSDFWITGSYRFNNTIGLGLRWEF